MGSSKGLQPLRSASKTLNALPAAYAGAQIASRRYAGTLANFKIPTVNNEPNVRENGEGVPGQFAN
jgi:1-pyrroline-5-carboxylate dehydrogenase